MQSSFPGFRPNLGTGRKVFGWVFRDLALVSLGALGFLYLSGRGRNKKNTKNDNVKDDIKVQDKKIDEMSKDQELNQIEMQNKIKELEEANKELEKFKKAYEGLKESKMRLQLFMDNRNMQISTLNDQIKKHKEQEVQFQQRERMLASIVAMIPDMVR